MSPKMTVLVVDDDSSMAKTLVDVLRIKGYQAHLAHSGAEALEIIDRAEIDLVLADVRMPNMNGVELYRAIQRIQPHLPTLLMTAYANDEVTQQEMFEGIEIVLDKPLDINALFTLLATYENPAADA